MMLTIEIEMAEAAGIAVFTRQMFIDIWFKISHLEVTTISPHTQDSYSK
jgi:hypothetical protein